MINLLPLDLALADFQLGNLEAFYQDVTTRGTRREPTMMDLIVSAHIQSEKDDRGPTRRWFLQRGLTIGAIAMLGVFPGAPVFAAGATFFAATTGDNSDGTTWAKAKTTITTGIAVCGAGDYLLVDATLVVTATAAITYTPPAGGLAIISVTPSGASSFSAFTAGATENVGAATAAFTIAAAASSAMYLFGLTMAAGTNVSGTCSFDIMPTATVNGFLEAKSCTISLPTTSTSASTRFGQNATFSRPRARFIDCTFSFGSRAGPAFVCRDINMEMINPTWTFGATKPASMFSGVAGIPGGGYIIVRDGDISSYTAGGLVDVAAWLTDITFFNLVVHATPTVTINTWLAGSNASITLQNVDSGNTDYEFQYTTGTGTLTADAGVFKNSGATFNGTPVSWKVVTTAACTEFNPFRTPYMQIWDTTNTSQTATVSIAQASGATGLTNRNCWAIIDFGASGTTTKYTFQSSRATQPFVAAGSTWATDTATWTGIATPVVQLIDTGALTASRDGLLRGQIAIAIATTTVYLDAKLEGIT